jgi:ABC-type uncharacterized transport system YnjBCD permease subunit
MILVYNISTAITLSLTDLWLLARHMILCDISRSPCSPSHVYIPSYENWFVPASSIASILFSIGALLLLFTSLLARLYHKIQTK